MKNFSGKNLKKGRSPHFLKKNFSSENLKFDFYPLNLKKNFSGKKGKLHFLIICVYFFLNMLEQKRKYIRTKPYKTKERCCMVCGDNNEDTFYSGQKNMCKKCKSDRYHNNPDKHIILERQKKWSQDNIIRFRVLAAKHRAKRKGIEFELTDEMIQRKLIEQNYKCYITGVQLTMDTLKYNSFSLDRKDSKLGYTEENTIIVTKFINWCKNDLDLDEFINLMKEACANF